MSGARRPGRAGQPGQAAGVVAVVDLAPEVGAALRAGRPVVALESTLISHGFPYPDNLAIARDSEAAVRSEGATPATVAIQNGRILVGLADSQLEALATAHGVRKVSRPTLAAALSAGGWGATTVSATMIAAHAAGIPVFATGGIGGVHRGALLDPTTGRRGSLDISADLGELARTPVAVVCAGPKLILDVALTVEALETLGVPLLTIGGEEVPGFWSRHSGVRAPLTVPDVDGAAAVVATHLRLMLGSGLLVCVPVPAADEVPRGRLEAVIDRATTEAAAQGIRGADLTPWLLARIAELTDGASVRANRSLILNNARTAARLAVRLTG